MSLICASLTWLRSYKRKQFELGLDWNDDASDEPDWIVEQAKARKRQDLLRRREDVEARLAKVRAKEKAQKDRFLRGETSVKRRRVEKGAEDDDQSDDQFALDDYESDREDGSKAAQDTSGFSAQTLALMNKLGTSIQLQPEDDEEMEEEVKVSLSADALRQVLIKIDLLLLQNAFSAYAIHK